MPEEKVEPRELNWRQLLPWTAIFQGFRVALDPSKLLLAALGILAMAIAWWVLAVIFFTAYTKPTWPDGRWANDWNKFKEERDDYNLMLKAAGRADSREVFEPEDLANSQLELLILQQPQTKSIIAAEAATGKTLEDVKSDARAGKLKVVIVNPADEQKTEHKLTETLVASAWQLRKEKPKPVGTLRTLPWYEDRGSNPYLLVTGRAGATSEDGSKRLVPWEKGHFVEWLVTEQVPVLLEPLVKMLEPVVYLFNPHASRLTRLYLLLVTLVTVAIWGLIGGAITRIAAVQVARQEKIGAKEALTFAVKRYLSFISAPMFPLILVAVIVLAMIVFGVFQMIPILGDLIAGILWPLMILAGLGIAVVLVGLVGWPLMSATVSTEGTDSWEAVSRSYSYVFGAPWHYLFYSVIALLYGAVLVFFVGFMGSAMVYLAKWGVKQTPGIQMAHRDPSFLFVYAPTSFEWRDLLLQGYRVEGEEVWRDGRPTEGYEKLMNLRPVGEDNKWEQMRWYNYIGAFLVMIWMFLLFLLILGFGYSYFWSASTIIYLLMRRKVDDTELDEVYLEEEEPEGPYSAGAAFSQPKPAPPAAAPANLTMIDSPTLRTTPKEDQGAAANPSPPLTAPPAEGNSPTGGGPS